MRCLQSPEPEALAGLQNSPRLRLPGREVLLSRVVWVLERLMDGEESESSEVLTFEIKPWKEASQADEKEGMHKF